MITEQDLQAAIAECKGQRNPNANTCLKLASFLTIQDHLFSKKEDEPIMRYSYSSGGSEINYRGESEFASLVNGMNQDDAFKILDELMDTLQVINPRLYASVIRKLKS